MNTSGNYPFNEDQATEAFDRQSVIFDEIYSKDQIVLYKRERVRQHVDALLKPASRILELNAGTGEDALYFARQGHFVHTTDRSAGMEKIRLEKIAVAGLSQQVSSERCSFTKLDSLKDRGPYDLVFSNFAGLNCTDQLSEVLETLPKLVKPGGLITLVVLPRICLWEMGLFFRGKWKTAFRRFGGKKGTNAHIEGVHFTCWYYDPSFIVRRLKNSFTPIRLQALCSFVPPAYIENFASKYPSLFEWLKKMEKLLGDSWPWNRIGDYYIISLKKLD